MIVWLVLNPFLLFFGRDKNFSANISCFFFVNRYGFICAITARHCVSFMRQRYWFFQFLFSSSKSLYWIVPPKRAWRRRIVFWSVVPTEMFRLYFGDQPLLLLDGFVLLMWIQPSPSMIPAAQAKSVCLIKSSVYLSEVMVPILNLPSRALVIALRTVPLSNRSIMLRWASKGSE